MMYAWHTEQRRGLGVPLGHPFAPPGSARERLGSRFPLQVRTRRASSLAGFPLQSLTRNTISVLAIGLATLASAQTVVTEVMPLQPPPEVIFRPQVLDSTLLFLSPDVVWRCSYMDGATGSDWFTADFARVERCDCAEETYRLLPYGRDFGGYEYKLATSKPRGSLVRTSDSTFAYTEYGFPDSTRIQRELLMVFDTSKVVWLDTLDTESLDGRYMKRQVSKFVELKAR